MNQIQSGSQMSSVSSGCPAVVIPQAHVNDGHFVSGGFASCPAEMGGIFVGWMWTGTVPDHYEVLVHNNGTNEDFLFENLPVQLPDGGSADVGPPPDGTAGDYTVTVRARRHNNQLIDSVVLGQVQCPNI